MNESIKLKQSSSIDLDLVVLVVLVQFSLDGVDVIHQVKNNWLLLGAVVTVHLINSKTSVGVDLLGDSLA